MANDKAMYGNAVVELSDSDDDQLPQSQVDPPPSSRPHSPASSYLDLTSDNDDDDELEFTNSVPSGSLSRHSSISGSVALDLSSDAEEDGLGYFAKLRTSSSLATPSPSSRSVATSASSSSPSKRKRNSQRHRLFPDDDELYSAGEELDSSPSKKPKYSSNLHEDFDFDGNAALCERYMPPEKSSGSKRPRLSQEERATKKAEADAAKAEKKRAREQEREDRKRRKEEDKAEQKRIKELERVKKKAQEASLKAEKKAFVSANVLQKDKKKQLKYMNVVLSSTLDKRHGGDLRFHLNRKFSKNLQQGEYPAISTAPSLMGDRCTIRVKKTDTKRFDHVQQQWDVCAEFTEEQNIAILWLDADELVHEIQTLSRTVDDLREAHNFHSVKDMVFILIYGLEACRDASRRHAEIQNALAMVQMTKHVHLLFAEDMADAAEKLYDFTADLGIKPHKMIERSHLPFCANIKMEKGRDLHTTFEKMLHQGIQRLTEPAAVGIAREFPTIRSLMERYAALHGQGLSGAKLLEDVYVPTRRDGAQKMRNRLGPAVSKRIHTVFFGDDHLELVDKEH